MMRLIGRWPAGRSVVAIFGLGGLLLLSAPQAASAQQMHDDGFALPWFRSRAEQMERQACIDNLPECRATVRRQIEQERAATRFTPWLALGVIVLVALLYVRKKEKDKERRRIEAMRHHVRPARRGRGAEDAPAPAAAGEDEGLGLGHPGDR